MATKADRLLARRILVVVKKWTDWALERGEMDNIKDSLDQILDEWAADDMFGTEQQSDPRGDGRECDGPHI